MPDPTLVGIAVAAFYTLSMAAVLHEGTRGVIPAVLGGVAMGTTAEPYATVTFEDVSIPGLRRIVCRVALNVTAMPRISELWAAADMAVASKECRGYAERTVFLYLPEMPTDLLAFAVAEYAGERPVDFRLQPASVIGTLWEAAADAWLHGGLAF